jgi:hypothetical protein
VGGVARRVDAAGQVDVVAGMQLADDLVGKREMDFDLGDLRPPGCRR